MEEDDSEISDNPIVKLTNAILLSAIKQSATAFRIRRDGEAYVVEFLVDGETREEMRGPIEIFTPVIRRLSVMANLPTYRQGHGATGPMQILVREDLFRFELEVSGPGSELRLSGRLLD